MDNCIFCQIKNKAIPVNLLYESDLVMAFPDVKPQAQVHILIIPKEHIPSFTQIEMIHKDIISDMIRVTQKLIINKAIEGKYRIMINGGALQNVPHLHWHLLGGKMKEEVQD